MEPGLGGGHVRYKGLYGLISDEINNFSVVLANGTASSMFAMESVPKSYYQRQKCSVFDLGIV